MDSSEQNQHIQVGGRANVEIRTFYKGERIGQDFLAEKPEIAPLYSDRQKEINQKRDALSEKTKNGFLSILDVTEDDTTEHPNVRQL